MSALLARLDRRNQAVAEFQRSRPELGTTLFPFDPNPLRVVMIVSLFGSIVATGFGLWPLALLGPVALVTIAISGWRHRVVRHSCGAVHLASDPCPDTGGKRS